MANSFFILSSQPQTQKFELGLFLRAKFAFPSSRVTGGVGQRSAFPSVVSAPRGRCDGSLHLLIPARPGPPHLRVASRGCVQCLRDGPRMAMVSLFVRIPTHIVPGSRPSRRWIGSFASRQRSRPTFSLRKSHRRGLPGKSFRLPPLSSPSRSARPFSSLCRGCHPAAKAVGMARISSGKFSLLPTPSSAQGQPANPDNDSDDEQPVSPQTAIVLKSDYRIQPNMHH